MKPHHVLLRGDEQKSLLAASYTQYPSCWGFALGHRFFFSCLNWHIFHICVIVCHKCLPSGSPDWYFWWIHQLRNLNISVKGTGGSCNVIPLGAGTREFETFQIKGRRELGVMRRWGPEQRMVNPNFQLNQTGNCRNLVKHISGCLWHYFQRWLDSEGSKLIKELTH